MVTGELAARTLALSALFLLAVLTQRKGVGYGKGTWQRIACTTLAGVLVAGMVAIAYQAPG